MGAAVQIRGQSGACTLPRLQPKSRTCETTRSPYLMVGIGGGDAQSFVVGLGGWFIEHRIVLTVRLSFVVKFALSPASQLLADRFLFVVHLLVSTIDSPASFGRWDMLGCDKL